VKDDQSALFYYLVDELFQLLIIVIAYEDHLTIAIATTKYIGESIHFENKNYYIYDLIGSNN
jgi:hypothetical protein